MDKKEVVQWLSSLTPKQFAEVIYEAAPKVALALADYKEQESRLILMHIWRDREEHGSYLSWQPMMICPSKEDWVDDAPLCQQGDHCGFATLSWDKRAVCPICGGDVSST